MRLRGKWSVIGDGGHLWLVMNQSGRVHAVYHYWFLAVNEATYQARQSALVKDIW